MIESSAQITELLRRVALGDASAREELYVAVEDSLRARAYHLLAGERAGHLLQTTILIDDAFLQLTDPDKPISWQHRRHFYQIASRAMRRILVDYARAAKTQKRGEGKRPLQLNEIRQSEVSRDFDLIALDDALKKLALEDKAKSEIVDLRYFGGHTIAEIAAITGYTVSQVKYSWELAKAWLYRELHR